MNSIYRLDHLYGKSMKRRRPPYWQNDLYSRFMSTNYWTFGQNIYKSNLIIYWALRNSWCSKGGWGVMELQTLSNVHRKGSVSWGWLPLKGYEAWVSSIKSTRHLEERKVMDKIHLTTTFMFHLCDTDLSVLQKHFRPSSADWEVTTLTRSPQWAQLMMKQACKPWCCASSKALSSVA